MVKYPLVSIGVLTYNNFEHLYETIESIICQDYSRIELIISDDGSNGYISNEVEWYILRNKGANITNYRVLVNEFNIGTVRHANRVLSFMNGDIIFFIAGDDVISNASIVTSVVKKFNELGETAQIITSQCAMYDKQLKYRKQLFLSEKQIEIIKDSTPLEMFRILALNYTIPAASTFYRRSFYSKNGWYDEDYKIIEDAPTFIRMCRNGIKVEYHDIISVKHRDGGISHGNTRYSRETFRLYWEDELKFYKKEVFPYLNMLAEDERRIVSKKYRNSYVRYKFRYNWRNMDLNKKIMFLLRYHQTIACIIKTRVVNTVHEMVYGAICKFRLNSK